ncbi:polysaccharide biosynthesis tyrosine autokinase [Gordonia jinghuaiqii]|uniref:polysaccharide biosynthesis tyrosine autokinase n=1 Tax=Gordonia jinghuaiqii TaxID=2758710 RepID=UPI001FD462B0|nr:polysaccharide biosynthesis tyrosine autokinase [Gordonia jinghuaiqii]
MRAVVVRRWWVVVACVVVGALVGLGASLLTTPKYQSEAVLYSTSATDTNAQSAYQGSLASQQRMVSYAELAQSDAVLGRAIEESDLPLSIADARSQISVTSKPGTVLLTIAAVDSNSDEAAKLANAVASSMVGYVSSLERPIDGGRPVATLTVITPASSTNDMVSPNTALNIALGVLGGLAIAALAMLAFYRLDTRVRNEEDLTSTGLGPVLATVPTSHELDSDRTADFAGGASPTAEAYRRLRTNLKFVAVDADCPRILVTSPAPGDGKTTTAVNLSLALAELGRSVILVGADLRKPGLGSRLAVDGAIGLTDYLRGDAGIQDVVQPSGFRNLDILASGPIPPNAGELLASERAGKGFDELASRYDHVIVDTPPVLPVADAVAVGQWMDGVLLVARSGRTTRPQLEQVMSQLSLARLKVLGCVLNDAAVRDTEYRYAYYGSDLPKAKGASSDHTISVDTASQGAHSDSGNMTRSARK